jgi:hypothetical protein
VRGILRKDFGQYLLMTALMMPWPLILLHEDGFDRGIVVMFAYTMLLAIPTAVMQNELKESTMGGYHFLSTLPLTTREIVHAKFLLIAAFTCAVAIYSIAVVRLIASPGVVFTISLGYLVLMGAVTLVLGALLLYIVYRFRLQVLSRLIAAAAPLTIALVTIAAHITFAEKTRGRLTAADLERFAGWASPANILIVLICAGLLFWLLLRAAIRAKAERED